MPSRKPARPSRRTRAASPASAHPLPAGSPVLIRKYPNRRLYDTTSSAHITQDDLYDLIARGAVVTVVDAPTGRDITSQTLAVALIERDPGRFGMVPPWFFHLLIRASEQSLASSMTRLWGAFVDPLLQMHQASPVAQPGMQAHFPWAPPWPGVPGPSHPVAAPQSPAGPMAASAVKSKDAMSARPRPHAARRRRRKRA